MTVAQRLVAFGLAVLVSFAVGYGVGDALDPVSEPQPPAHQEHGR